MCGRFALYSPFIKLQNELETEIQEITYNKSYNITPTTNILTLGYNNGLKLALLRWGLIPYGSLNKKIGSKLINARAETIIQKPSFKDSFYKRRCIIIADGFYEWERIGKYKKPVYFSLKSKKLMFFAGIYDIWIDNDKNKIYSCSIITTSANKQMEKIHNRMPVIISKMHFNKWLAKTIDIKDINTMFNSDKYEELDYYNVSDYVNSPKNNSLKCIIPKNA